MTKHRVAINLIFAAWLIALIALILCAPDLAYAQLPASYVEQVQDAQLDWWSDALKLDEAKEMVDGWLNDDSKYDFSALEDDPVVIAILDSGVNIGHDLFSGSIGKSDEKGIDQYDVLLRDDDGDIVGRNTVGNDTNFSDVAMDGHGTHVAGIAATLIHSLGLEKYIKIMPIRAGTSSAGGASFTVSNVKEGISFALEHGADVVNMSIESTSADFDVVSDEWAKKAIFVAAAGNGRMLLGSRQGYDSAYKKCYPAASENVIGVMNISNELDEDGNLQLSMSSNFGDAYDLCAPGAAIYSAAKGANADYISKSGTSMAAPVVSFASALAMLKFRAVEAKSQVFKSVEDIREIVKSSSTKYISKGNYQLGVLDLNALAEEGEKVSARVDIISGSEIQRLGEVSPVKLRMNVRAATLKDEENVEWFLGAPDGERIGEGFEFAFTPKNEVGKQIVCARWTAQTDEGTISDVATFAVTVEYAELTRETLDSLKIGIYGEDGKLLENVKFDKNIAYVITFEGVENYSPDVLANIEWYANGKLIGKGKEVLFKPDVDGKYEICVKIGSMSSATCVVEFTSNKTIAYVCYALVAAAVLTVAILVIIRAYGSFSAAKRK